MTPQGGSGTRLETFGALGYRCAALACTFVAGILIARFLGPAGKGLLAILVLGPDTIARLAELGLTSASVRDLGRERATLGQVHGNLLKLVGFLVALLAGGYLLVGLDPLRSLLPDMSPALLGLIVLLAPLALYVHVWQGLMAGLGHQRRAQRVLFVVQALFVAAIVALAGSGAPFWMYAAVVVTTFTLRAGAAWGSLARLRDDARPRFRGGRLGSALRFGSVVYVGAIVSHVLYRADQFVVAEALGMEAVGHYSVAATLAEYPWIVTTVICLGVKHLVAAGTSEEAVSATCEASRHAVLAGVVLTLAAIPLARPFVALLFSDAFLPSVLPLLLLLPGTFAIAVAQNLFSWLVLRRGRPAWLAAAAGAGLVVHLPLLFWLLPGIGIAGAAVASTAGYLVVLAGASAVFRAESGCALSDFLVPRRSDVAAYGRLLGDLRRAWSRRPQTDG